MKRLRMSSIAARVKDSVDIVTLVQEYLPLKKAGCQWIALCPFHQEKTPSFKVSATFFKCFGCGKGGTVIDFVMAIEGLTVAAAVKTLAERYGVPLEEQEIPKAKLDLTRRLAEEAAYFWNAYQDKLVRLRNEAWDAERKASIAMLAHGLDNPLPHRNEEWIWFWSNSGIAEAMQEGLAKIENATPKSLVEEYRRLKSMYPWLEHHCRRQVVRRRDINKWLVKTAKDVVQVTAACA